ncbi:nematode resistance protein-like HSPRO2 [Punica granatum]|uniref:Uncharacterized protein n=2 Tax=Punica granatum TaxID=22663 RepID=A0A218WAS0_PUNGR|nr:nematode resistance protein-like HSPRO2 [Punica granatum]OWM69974.1 hypothetical protein CDL15_Pgr025823 [Punica granatum]PKI39589.1 hypothetical protein CRG98_040059 [Punica granatum]
MVDFDCKSKLVSSPKLPLKLRLLVAAPPFRGAAPDLATASDSACSAYEQYLRLPELTKLWSAREFPNWRAEQLLRPALQALEITFRFISTTLSDPRPYANRQEWSRRLELLAASQIELIAGLIENEEEEGIPAAPVADLRSGGGTLARTSSSSLEVWRLPGESGEGATVVSRTSEESLLPRLATWRRSEGVAQKILYTVECQMSRCPYTLGLGEPNLTGKPSLDYDIVCKPSELHSLTKKPNDPYDKIENHENLTIYSIHQILESWIHAAVKLLELADESIESRSFAVAARRCFLLQRVWKLMEEIEDLHLLMDPDNLLRLMKSQLGVKSEAVAFCFRSRGLVEMTRMCGDLRHRVPYILGVEVDPSGGPGMQEAAMRLYREHTEPEKVHLLQALQAVESATKRFFYANKQVVAAAMGSLESTGDSLSQFFLEPTHFPSLDAAKTFLGEQLSSCGR